MINIVFHKPYFKVLGDGPPRLIQLLIPHLIQISRAFRYPEVLQEGVELHKQLVTKIFIVLHV